MYLVFFCFSICLICLSCSGLRPPTPCLKNWSTLLPIYGWWSESIWFPISQSIWFPISQYDAHEKDMFWLYLGCTKFPRCLKQAHLQAENAEDPKERSANLQVLQLKPQGFDGDPSKTQRWIWRKLWDLAWFHHRTEMVILPWHMWIIHIYKPSNINCFSVKTVDLNLRWPPDVAVWPTQINYLLHHHQKKIIG